MCVEQDFCFSFYVQSTFPFHFLAWLFDRKWGTSKFISKWRSQIGPECRNECNFLRIRKTVLIIIFNHVITLFLRKTSI
ncbi:hypothetical protein FKM82_000634 [Ascaphus truei]